MLMRGSSIFCISWGMTAPAAKISAKAITIFTAGPASATASSCPGFSGMRSKLATPPMGNSVTSGVLTPKRRAVRIWPNSCSNTHANSSTMKSTFRKAASPPSRRRALAPIQTRNRMKVIWMRTAVPAMRPMVTDQGM